MDPLIAPIRDAEHREIGGAKIDIVRAGTTRVGRVVYPPGFRWSTHVKPLVKTALCEHAHVGFLARGRIQATYPDGCTFEFSAPAVLVLEPGHDAWVVGEESAVLVQFDAEGDTAPRFGLAGRHRHD
ncbi:MAG TPA: hypothetical protein VEQ10_01710 [Vicinamibacteria bacterium]|nr:hypothetical protein [Vicinamibacteria bacterium]